MSDRKHPWLYEQDGDLNPTWILVVIYSLVGIVAAVSAALSDSAAAKVAALSFLGAMIVALLISALPKDKAKILAKSRAPGSIAKAIASARPYGDSTEDYDVDVVLGGHDRD